MFVEPHRIEIGDGVTLQTDGDGAEPGTRTDVFIPFESIHIGEADSDELMNRIPGSVKLVSFQGFSTLIKVATKAGDVVARVPGTRNVRERDDVVVQIPRSAVRCFPFDD